jgi:hypothetical protein
MSCFLFVFDLTPCSATRCIVPFMDRGYISIQERKYNSIFSNSSTLDPVFDGILIVRHKWFTSIVLFAHVFYVVRQEDGTTPVCFPSIS